MIFRVCISNEKLLTILITELTKIIKMHMVTDTFVRGGGTTQYIDILSTVQCTVQLLVTPSSLFNFYDLLLP